MGRKVIHKILLIQPPYFCRSHRGDLTPNPPLGLAYLATVLEKAGYEISILDAFVEARDTETPVTADFVRVGLPFQTTDHVAQCLAPDPGTIQGYRR